MPYLIFPSLFLNPEFSILPPGWTDTSRALILGGVLAAYPLGQFVGSPILGALSDDYGRKKLLTGSLLISAVCNLFTGFAVESQHLVLLIISRFMAGLMEGNIAIARAMAADIKSISKHESFGKINAVTSIAFLIGPFFGGLLTDKSLFEGLTIATPFFLITILFVGLAGVAAFVLHEAHVKSAARVRSVWERINLVKRMSALFANRQLKFLMIVSTIFTLAIDIFYEFAPVHLTVKWGVGPAQLIYFNGILCLALAVGNAWLPRFLSRRAQARLLISFSILAFAVFVTGISFVDSVGLMMTLFGLIGLVIGLGVTLITVKLSDSAPDSIQGEVMGTQMSLRVLCDGLICLVGGALLVLSSKLILLVAAFLSIGTLIYYRKYGTLFRQ
ncbi:MAG: MFS transporter [Verrucomicrobia bacterium]|nr:MFS transporter [Verrucomicrobiota bacterium]